jgi:2-polyprenyl-6-hydroxyphenyl methylase/3-demethylubiquinone-9 3-methyltransferase
MNNEQLIKIWGQGVPANLIKTKDREYLRQFDLDEPPPVEEIWHEMDKVWDALGLSSTAHPNSRQLAAFYSHPVWILNGFFSASDPQSCAHRDAIAKAALELCVRSIADFGGGMGELAIRMARSNPDYEISIVEPYPSDIGRHRVSQFSNISYVHTFNESYDLTIAQDVLEHVDDPVGLAAQLSNATKIGGYLIFANCFYPVIKCHLPSTFHLRDTFSWVVKGAGLEFIGNVAGAEHASIFKKARKVDVLSLRGCEYYSKLLSFVKNHTRSLKKQAKNLINRK